MQSYSEVKPFPSTPLTSQLAFQEAKVLKIQKLGIISQAEEPTDSGIQAEPPMQLYMTNGNMGGNNATPPPSDENIATTTCKKQTVVLHEKG